MYDVPPSLHRCHHHPLERGRPGLSRPDPRKREPSCGRHGFGVPGEQSVRDVERVLLERRRRSYVAKRQHSDASDRWGFDLYLQVGESVTNHGQGQLRGESRHPPGCGRIGYQPRTALRRHALRDDEGQRERASHHDEPGEAGIGRRPVRRERPWLLVSQSVAAAFDHAGSRGRVLARPLACRSFSMVDRSGTPWILRNCEAGTTTCAFHLFVGSTHAAFRRYS